MIIFLVTLSLAWSYLVWCAGHAAGYIAATNHARLALRKHDDGAFEKELDADGKSLCDSCVEKINKEQNL